MVSFTPLLILQVFCLYHAYTNKVDVKWYFLIILIPLIGSLIYLYYHFVNRQNIKTVSQGVESILNTDSQLLRLEKQMEFSDTVQNKTLVADKYVELGRYLEATDLYESCLEGYNQNDPKTIQKLVKAYYLDENYEKSVSYGNKLKGNPYFLKSEDAICYAWSLYYTGKVEEAEALFSKMDVAFANYIHRMEYAKFLHELDRKEEAIAKLEESISEFDHMESHEKRNMRQTIRAIELLYKEFQTVPGK